MNNPFECNDSENVFQLPCLIAGNASQQYQSTFSHTSFAQERRGDMLLSPQIMAKNFRLRQSPAGYSSHWHTAGDPTLIVIQHSILRIIMRDNSYRDFSAGDMFIASDALPVNVEFDEQIHGHRAEVIGNDMLCAIHIKLSSK